MGEVTTLLFRNEEATERLAKRSLTMVARRGPLLRPSPVSPGVYGLDLTAGCDHGCPFCHIQVSARYPGKDRVLFDPRVVERLEDAFHALELQPKTVVLSPSSEPFPAQRAVRESSERVIDWLLARGIRIELLTRGRVSRRLVAKLAAHSGRVRVGMAFTTVDRKLTRILEPRAATPRGRLRTLTRLLEAGVAVDVRLEPLIAGLTDTEEVLRPLFRGLARAGVRNVVAHYLFVNSVITESLGAALSPLGWTERIGEAYQSGPVFGVGTLGPMKHLLRETRQAGLAHLSSLGAGFGLLVETGAAQNPDLRRDERSRA
jgi:DNA repair photolyase